MEHFSWWTEEQIGFAGKVEGFVKELMPRDAETRWTRQFPWDIFRDIGAGGFTGAAIPKEYGGLGLGATGACIAAEAMGRMPGVSRVFVGNMLGGLRQLMEYGTEEQKRRFLPRIAKGEIGAIVITEPFAGTDAAGIETSARREGDTYVLNGKKRFIVSAGVAGRYMVYARTSSNPDDVGNYRHLTAFVVEKGAPGFTVEKINEVMGFMNIQNGVLDFHNVPVSAANRVGEEGEGWRVMTVGLNFERTLICAMVSGWIGELLRNVASHVQRRVQFGRPTVDIPENQFKIANLIIKKEMARLATYNTAHLWDLGRDITVESNVSKVFCCEAAVQASLDAIQAIGGDAVTPFYPLAEIMGQSKVENMGGGTMEACRLVIFRTGMRTMAKDFTMQRRIIHPTLGVPVPVAGRAVKETEVDEGKLLNALAEDYRINPGLYMSRDDLKEVLDVDDGTLDRLLVSLEEKGLVKLMRATKGIQLAKATYEGLDRAHPPEYYRWFPDWIEKGGDRTF